MASDVRLEGEQVILDAWDLVLHSEERQGAAPGEQRRALVHDTGDRLTINWGHDYIGGLKLVGVRRISAYSPPGIIATDRDELQIDGVVKGAKVEVTWESYELDHEDLSQAFWVPIAEGQAEKVELEKLLALFLSRIMECGRWILDLDGRVTENSALQQRVADLEASLAAVNARVSQLAQRVTTLEEGVG